MAQVTLRRLPSVSDFVDNLDRGQRQRILQAEKWETSFEVGDPTRDDPKCVVWHAFGEQPDSLMLWAGVGARYDQLCERFGKERVVSAIKKRVTELEMADSLPS